MFNLLLGIVVGAVATNIYNKNEKVREGVKQGGECIKKYAEIGYEKSKELASEAKKKIDEFKEKRNCMQEEKCDEKQGCEVKTVDEIKINEIKQDEKPEEIKKELNKEEESKKEKAQEGNKNAKTK